MTRPTGRRLRAGEKLAAHQQGIAEMASLVAVLCATSLLPLPSSSQASKRETEQRPTRRAVIHFRLLRARVHGRDPIHDSIAVQRSQRSRLTTESGGQSKGVVLQQQPALSLSLPFHSFPELVLKLSDWNRSIAHRWRGPDDPNRYVSYWQPATSSTDFWRALPLGSQLGDIFKSRLGQRGRRRGSKQTQTNCLIMFLEAITRVN